MSIRHTAVRARRSSSRPRAVRIAVLGCAALLAAACGSSASSSSAGSNSAASSSAGSNSAGSNSAKDAITIGYLGDFTGPASSTFGTGYGGALARIQSQNAAGGVDGHMLNLIKADTGSTPSGAALAMQSLVSQHPFGIIVNSAFTFAGARYAEQAGIPVTGYGLDGPEWFQQPYSNMFDANNLPVGGSVEGKNYTFTWLAKFLKQVGVSSFGIVANTSPTGIATGLAQAYTAKQAGLSTCYTNTSVPLGGVDFTAQVLQIKQAGCDGVSGLLIDSADIALAQTIKNAGLQSKMKAVVFASGYDNTLLDQPSALAAVQGDYFFNPSNFTTPNAPSQQMLATLKKYDSQFASGGIPGIGVFDGYVSADLMVFGLQHAGSNPTQASFISGLRQVNDYTAGGILASPVHFGGFGTTQMLPKTACSYVFQVQHSAFVPVAGADPICGGLAEVPGA